MLQIEYTASVYFLEWSNPSKNVQVRLDTVLIKKILYGSSLWIGLTVSRLQSHYEETIYFLPLSPYMLLGLIFGLNQLRKDERLSRSFFRASQWF